VTDSFLACSDRVNLGNIFVKEPSRRTVVRKSDEPRLEIGESICVKDGVLGIILARFVPSNSSDVHYIVEVRPNEISGVRSDPAK